MKYIILLLSITMFIALAFCSAGFFYNPFNKMNLMRNSEEIDKIIQEKLDIYENNKLFSSLCIHLVSRKKEEYNVEVNTKRIKMGRLRIKPIYNSEKSDVVSI